MSIIIPHWLRAALIGAAPMLGLVFLILFTFTLLGIVQRLKIILQRACMNSKKPKLRTPTINANKNITVLLTNEETNNVQTVISNDNENNQEEYQQQLLLNKQSNPIVHDHLDSILMIDMDTSSPKLSQKNINQDDTSSIIQLKIRSSKSEGKLNESMYIVYLK
ncbi:unnamed protein product [Didymodactylos carnosus]|uniref:Uncharacterized protein n=1 Tax=Didymodactylos carnosus TaxID=1234261 RepID=A0A813PMU6_9BILA|nr:unnamed protein product [Didymodactylos carnosus]CAF0998272.1 unnamed protein product [Didymodactylos carnosus]CAF3532701.1 unnamed protein product [Didymodactylos carnosus]CAF3767839.1 unnamed protein product [Didymodactylos carnosus]